MGACMLKFKLQLQCGPNYIIIIIYCSYHELQIGKTINWGFPSFEILARRIKTKSGDMDYGLCKLILSA